MGCHASRTEWESPGEFKMTGRWASACVPTIVHHRPSQPGPAMALPHDQCGWIASSLL